MRKYPKVLGCIFVLIFFLLSSCSVIISDNSISNNQGTDSTVPAVPGEENQDNTTTPENPNTTKPDSNTPETSDQDKNEPQNPEEGGETIPPKEEDKKPDDTVSPGDSAEQKPQGEEYKPEPKNITDSSVIKLNRQNLSNSNNNDKIYLMLRFLGKSEKGFWKKDFDGVAACPRGFALDYNEIEATTVLNFNELDIQKKIAVGYECDFDLGFTDWGGTKLFTNFYYGDNNISVSKNDTNDVTFTFANFAIWDPTINGEFMESSHPDFVRYPSNKFKITVPMKDYNPDIHNNVAYLTVYFEPDKGETGNLFPYVVVLDGFEPK